MFRGHWPFQKGWPRPFLTGTCPVLLRKTLCCLMEVVLRWGSVMPSRRGGVGDVVMQEAW